MPIYEYECEKCGHAFEREQAMSDPPIKTCPACRSRRVIKLISRTAFVLKGGGWYADGYSDKKTTTSGDGDAAGETKAAGETTSEKSTGATADAAAPTSSEKSTAPTSGEKKIASTSARTRSTAAPSKPTRTGGGPKHGGPGASKPRKGKQRSGKKDAA